MIMKISQSDRVEDHIQIMCESLEIMHFSKPKADKFLSASHLRLFLAHLNPIPKFVKPSQKYDEQYKVVEELVEKFVGDDEPEVVSRFLRSLFSCHRERVTSNSIFAKVKYLADKISSRLFNFGMKKLVDKFTKGESVEFFQKMYSELRDDESF